MMPIYAKRLAALVAVLMTTGASAQTLLGPTAYGSFDDSPFKGTSFSQFHLEDFQDGERNTPGLGVVGQGVVYTTTPGGLADSIEFTPNGSSFYGPSGGAGLTFLFDADVLGALPTHAGLVWTDGLGLITFEAFDQNGVSLGTVTGNHADSSFYGTTIDDRFYGAIHDGGISKIFIKSVSGGIEVDHVQYGIAGNPPANVVPEPASWAMMITGFGLAGGMLRRRRATGQLVNH